MRKRLQVAIKLLLKENPIIPNTFKFRGKCLIEKYKAEERFHVEKEYSKLMSEQDMLSRQHDQSKLSGYVESPSPKT